MVSLDGLDFSPIVVGSAGQKKAAVEIPNLRRISEKNAQVLPVREPKSRSRK